MRTSPSTTPAMCTAACVGLATAAMLAACGHPSINTRLEARGFRLAPEPSTVYMSIGRWEWYERKHSHDDELPEFLRTTHTIEDVRFVAEQVLRVDIDSGRIRDVDPEARRALNRRYAYGWWRLGTPDLQLHRGVPIELPSRLPAGLEDLRVGKPRRVLGGSAWLEQDFGSSTEDSVWQYLLWEPATGRRAAFRLLAHQNYRVRRGDAALTGWRYLADRQTVRWSTIEYRDMLSDGTGLVAVSPEETPLPAGVPGESVERGTSCVSPRGTFAVVGPSSAASARGRETAADSQPVAASLIDLDSGAHAGDLALPGWSGETFKNATCAFATEDILVIEVERFGADARTWVVDTERGALRSYADFAVSRDPQTVSGVSVFGQSHGDALLVNGRGLTHDTGHRIRGRIVGARDSLYYNTLSGLTRLRASDLRPIRGGRAPHAAILLGRDADGRLVFVDYDQNIGAPEPSGKHAAPPQRYPASIVRYDPEDASVDRIELSVARGGSEKPIYGYAPR